MTVFLLLLFQSSTVAEDATQPRVVIAPGGTVHVVMIRQGKIQVSLSRDQGRTFEAPVTALEGQGEGGMDRGPRIGVDGKGILTVTAPIDSELWLSRSSDLGQSWSKPVRINEVSKKAAEALHALAVAEDGTAHVAWLDSREGNTNGLWYATVKGGKPGRNLRLVKAVCECCAPGIAIDGKGNPVIVVREGRKSDRGVLLLRSTNGGALFSSPVRVTPSPSGVDT